VATVLIAVVDPEERRTVASGYRLTGNDVLEAADAAACLAHLEKSHPDALVLDPRLPGLEDSQLLRIVRRSPALSGMKVSLLAHDMDADRWEFLGRQFFDVVVEESGVDLAGALAAGPSPAKKRRTGGARTSKSMASAEGGSKTILVVEDEPTYGVLLGTEFRAMGWETLGAESGEAALEVLRAEKVEAVLSDINLPGMGGGELAFKLRSEMPAVKVVLMTGLPRDRYPKVPKDVPILPKPISVKELMAAMKFMQS
jgi:CheY-like chemotaxis protein